MLKEDIQAISQIIQEGYLDGTFASITDWSVLNTTDPIVQYFTSKLGGVVRQCPRGTVAPPCNIRISTEVVSHEYTDHSGRWVMSNGTTISLAGGGALVNAGFIYVSINSKPQFNNGIGNQMPIFCNIADTPFSKVNNPTLILKPSQCGSWLSPTYVSSFYNVRWEQLFS